MLCQFSFRNFRSYKNESTFDFQATAAPEFAESLIKQDKCNSLLPVSAIYGPNGGGKSNLIRALSALISAVVVPICELKQNHKKMIFQHKQEVEPFLYDTTSKNEPTEFRVFFRLAAYEYQYYLAFLNGEIAAESLSRKKIGGKKPARLYDREGGKIDLGPMLKKENVATNVNSKMPYLSFLAITYNIPVIAEVQEWFESCIIRNYALQTAEMQYIFLDDGEIKQEILTFLQNMDVDIEDYRFDEKEQELYIKRNVMGEAFELTFAHESEGTKKLLSVLSMAVIALMEGRLLIADELDAKLHPKLLRYVISMFKNPALNKHGAQLLFTSHDVTTMKNTVFRRDEIWFSALDKERSSILYSLYDIRREDNERVNSTAAFDKQYLEGRYGADPYLRSMLDGGEWK